MHAMLLVPRWLNCLKTRKPFSVLLNESPTPSDSRFLPSFLPFALATIQLEVYTMTALIHAILNKLNVIIYANLLVLKYSKIIT